MDVTIIILYLFLIPLFIFFILSRNNIGIFIFYIYVVFTIKIIKRIINHNVLNCLLPVNNNQECREIPCEYDVAKIYLIGHEYDIIPNADVYIGGLIFKWTINKNIVPIMEETKDKRVKFKLIQSPNDEMEAEMYNIMQKIAKDNILDSGEFRVYYEIHRDEIEDWFAKLKKLEFNKLVDERILNFWLFGKKLNKYLATAESNKIAEQLNELKNFLNNKESLKDANIDSNKWIFYMLYAQLFDIASDVYDEYTEIYPEYQNSDINKIISKCINFSKNYQS